jgi:hypothetical protein
LLGENHSLPGGNTVPEREKFRPREIRPVWAEGLRVKEFICSSEDHVWIPAMVVYPPPGKETTAIEIYLSEGGRAAVEKAPGPYLERVRQGAEVVLADLRFSGDYSLRQLAGRIRPELLRFKQASLLGVSRDPAVQVRNLAAAWDRNGILWGRPIPGMMVHDLARVLASVATLSPTREPRFQIIARDTPALALTALFSACLDPRITAIDADFKGHCFARGAGWQNDPAGLPNVTRILCSGDVFQWAAVLANRRVTLRHVPYTEAERQWLEAVFARLGNQKQLKLAD